MTTTGGPGATDTTETVGAVISHTGVLAFTTVHVVVRPAGTATNEQVLDVCTQPAGSPVSVTVYTPGGRFAIVAQPLPFLVVIVNLPFGPVKVKVPLAL